MQLASVINVENVLKNSAVINIHYFSTHLIKEINNRLNNQVLISRKAVLVAENRNSSTFAWQNNNK